MTLDHPSTDIGVFFCGPKALSRTLHMAANRHTTSQTLGTKFFYHKENF
jgi:NADPH oxidase